MAVVVEFPLTHDQRLAKERLHQAMREFNEAVKFAAKIGLEVEVSLVTAYATYSAKPLNWVTVAANIPGYVPPSDIELF
ncbi:hypothetical protein [Ensifer adhaerens]|uniref:hypothetical protein n=1 Tax=Ensifer adhaerens TaxID=106592 RepID=UPI000CF12520|nr:hypothetical protein [Ensifer adhaerens]